MKSELQRNWQRRAKLRYGAYLAVGALVCVSLWWARPDQWRVLWGLPGRLAWLLDQLFPPDWSRTGTILGSALETFLIAVGGTAIAFAFALPLGFLAASNVSPGPVVHAMRTLFAIVRSLPLVVVAIIAVILVGLGPFAGLMAMAFHSVGMLAKFYAEEFETADAGIIAAVGGTGATRLQTLRFGLLQQCVPQVVAFTFYRLEMNFRDATILGLVGAGGIGFYVRSYIGGGNYGRAAVLLLVIMAVVTAIDQLTYWVRRWVR